MKGATPGLRKRFAVWMYNGLFGKIAMAKQGMLDIGQNEQGIGRMCSPAAKEMARKIFHDLTALQEELRNNRIEYHD